MPSNSRRKPAASLGRRLREMRRELNLTQRDLADLALMDTNSIGRIERGTANPSLETLNRLAAVLNTTVSDLTVYVSAEDVPENDRKVTVRDLQEARGVVRNKRAG